MTGIGGGLISGFVVYFVTSHFFQKKQNKEYIQKIQTANNEILYAMRPLIAQKQVPSLEIINSVINSTARKYEIDKSDLSDSKLITDDLIKEVMENSFLNPENKLEFCIKIDDLKESALEVAEGNQVFNNLAYRQDRISSKKVSALLAATSSTMVLASMLFLGTRNKLEFEISDSFSELSEIILIAISAPVIATLFFMIISNTSTHNNRSRYLDKEDGYGDFKERINDISQFLNKTRGDKD